MLDELPLPARAGDRRIAGTDLNKPRIRAALSAALALAPAPAGFTAVEHAAKVRTMAGHDGYTTRQAAVLRCAQGPAERPGTGAACDVPQPNHSVVANGGQGAIRAERSALSAIDDSRRTWAHASA
jgi:hypothetical protein